MKKIINGKRYDTSTATLIDYYMINDIGFDKVDKSDVEAFRKYIFEKRLLEQRLENLYRKKTGEFFLYTLNVPMSRLAERKLYGIADYENIVPLTVDEAKEWLEECSDAETYESVFEIEDEGNIACSVLIPENLYNKLKGTPVMVKGGHLPGSPTDYLFDGALHKFQSERLNSHNTHGTGCVLSSAIASYKAQGLELKDAIAQAKQFLFNAIKQGANYKHGNGCGPLYLVP